MKQIKSPSAIYFHFPYPNSNRYAILHNFYKFGPMSTDDYLLILGDYSGKKSVFYFRRELAVLVSQECLIVTNGIYQVTTAAKHGFSMDQRQSKKNELGPNVLPAFKPMNKPWSGAFNISACANRDDAIQYEERPHYSGAARAEPHLRGW